MTLYILCYTKQDLLVPVRKGPNVLPLSELSGNQLTLTHAPQQHMNPLATARGFRHVEDVEVWQGSLYAHGVFGEMKRVEEPFVGCWGHPGSQGDESVSGTLYGCLGGGVVAHGVEEAHGWKMPDVYLKQG